MTRSVLCLSDEFNEGVSEIKYMYLECIGMSGSMENCGYLGELNFEFICNIKPHNGKIIFVGLESFYLT